MLSDVAPILHLADSVLYLSSMLRDHPRPIDRYIDYFGEGSGAFASAAAGPWATRRAS